MATVNRPTNVAQKEADIEQKLRLYGIFNGKLFIATFPTAHREAGVPQLTSSNQQLSARAKFHR